MQVKNIDCGISRRGLLLGFGATGLTAMSTACTSTTRERGPQLSYMPPSPEEYSQMYSAVSDDGYIIPAAPFERIGKQYLRQTVENPTGEGPGTVVVDTSRHFLYLVQKDGSALRYGVGLGRAGFEWSGRAVVQWKRKWPTWTPPAEMIARDPKLAKYSADNGGMKPGLDNPLGSRALYIFQDGVDTLYRLHGTPEWASIGKSVSSGCVRLLNQDVIDLYGRVPNRTPILVV
ncbi:MAG: L,D-transpeptidase [Mesorhizobium sp.]|nr:L,D-transpeptidase [Mesorhizobium sp.]MBL8580428.1 L,D-transpeptidase [Mesorhizobium sp.]